MASTNYRIVTSDKDKIVLQDVGPWNEFKTITNDAEHVVQEMLCYLDGRRLLYYDSEGELVELVIEEGKFVGFSIIPSKKEKVS